MKPIEKMEHLLFKSWQAMRQIESIARILEEKTLQENEEIYLLIKLILEKIVSQKAQHIEIERVFDFEITMLLKKN